MAWLERKGAENPGGAPEISEDPLAKALREAALEVQGEVDEGLAFLKNSPTHSEARQERVENADLETHEAIEIAEGVKSGMLKSLGSKLWERVPNFDVKAAREKIRNLKPAEIRKVISTRKFWGQVGEKKSSCRIFRRCYGRFDALWSSFCRNVLWTWRSDRRHRICDSCGRRRYRWRSSERTGGLYPRTEARSFER